MAVVVVIVAAVVAAVVVLVVGSKRLTKVTRIMETVDRDPGWCKALGLDFHQ